MYLSSSSGQALESTGEAPNLRSTSSFWEVIETLPDDCYVPIPLVKLGLMAGQLEPTDGDISVKFSQEDILEGSDVTLLPETLMAVRQLLLRLSSDLDENTKKVIGEFCEITGLNCPPQEGASLEAVREAAPPPSGSCPPFFLGESSEESAEKENDGLRDEADGEDEENEADNEEKTEQNSEDDEESPNHNPSSSDSPDPDPFASGKEVTKNRGERKTGKNPFADTTMLKDTGLHQGGG